MVEAVKKQFNPKIALVGSGMIGGTLGLLAGMKKLSGNIVLLDIVDGMPQGKALDLSQGLACAGVSCAVAASSDITEKSEGLKDADVVLVTAGFPRKPGMSREDLLGKNAEVIGGVGKAIKAQCPDAFVICITNPLDVMVSVLQKASGLPHNRVVGMAGILDTSRFCYFLATELKVSAADIQSLVIGGHGDEMVPLINYTAVGGIPLKTLIKMGKITEKRVEEIVQRTRNGGGEIVSLLKTGSAFKAPAFAALTMVEAYLKDERRLVPACAMVGDEFGGELKGMYFGVPVIIGAGGVEAVVDVPLEDSERELMMKSLNVVKASRKICQDLGYQC